MDIILFGMQGAGKGTLGKALAARYNLQIFETGGELRKLSSQDNALAKKVKSIIEAGRLVPNEVVMEIVENFMTGIPANAQILFDGIPRQTEQANSLNSLLKKWNRTYKALLIEISKETALKRLTTRRICKVCKTVYPVDYKAEKCKCGGELVTRSDDNPQAIKTRLEAFETETIPAIKMYSENLITIPGEASIEEVEKLAIAELDKIFK